MWDAHRNYQVLLPTAYSTALEHEAAFAVDTTHDGDTADNGAAIFSVDVPGERWIGMSLSVADGPAIGQPSGVSSAFLTSAFEARLIGAAEGFALHNDGWQHAVAVGLGGAIAQAHVDVDSVVAVQARPTPSDRISLTTATVLGDWLCVAHDGDGQVYRLTQRRLQCLTPTSPLPQLDAPASPHSPAITFHQLHRRDMLLVGSHTLFRQLDGAAILRLLKLRRPVAEIVDQLVAAARAGGGAAGLTACVARVGRLRARRLAAPRTHAPPLMPRQRVVPSSTSVVRVASLLGVLLLADVLAGSALLKWPREAPSRRPTPSAIVVQPLAALPPVVEVTSEAGTAPEITEPVPSPTVPVTRPVAAAVALVEPASPRSPPAQLARSAVIRPSTVPIETPPTEEVIAPLNDSVLQLRDAPSVPLVALADRPPLKASLAEVRAAVPTTAPVATVEASAIPGAAASPESDALRMQSALAEWLGNVVRDGNAGRSESAALTSGTASFVAWVREREPRLSQPQLLGVMRSNASGTGTAAWTARWRTTFGPTITRRMTAQITLVPDGDGWRVRAWRVVQGAP